MAKFTPKSYQQVVAAMVAKMSAETPLSDFNDGSVVLTLLEAAAQEDFQQYVEMLNIIRNYNLDTTEGDDLDNRAAEYGLTRKPASPHSGFVTIVDNRFTKISSKLYAGLPGPVAGSLTIFVDNATLFPSSGTIYIGRGTANSESVNYSAAPVDNTSYWAINLDTALLNDHGTDETVVLSQFGNREVVAGTEVEIPENDFSDQVLFEINQTVELLDGEDTIENVLVTALDPGAFNVPANAISSFPNEPFTGASVFNPLPFVNGRDEETDQELRDRIRDTIQSLSRGTSGAVETGILGVVDEDTNQSVVSASIVSPVILADGPTKVFIDNGRGLEPTLAATGLETIVTNSTGGESFFQLQNFPVSKANLITQSVEPFTLSGFETLNFRVGTSEETFTFLASDFEVPGTAKATEIAEAINNRASLIEARTITEADGRKVIINPKISENEDLQILDGSTANTAMNFNTDLVSTLKLYKDDKLLTKDGLTASILTAAQPYDFSASIITSTDGDITVTGGSRVVTKSVSGNDPFTQYVHPGDYIKFSSDADVFYKRVRTVVNDTKLLLEEEYPASSGGTGDITIWNSPQLEISSNGDLEETEVISFSPNDFSNFAQALASEVLARVQLELNLSKAELAVNSTRIKFISQIENNASSKIQALGGFAAIALGLCTVELLTGTIDVSGGSRIVTGTGTAFTTELVEGQWIKAGADGTGSWTKIETIENDTTLYLAEPYRGTDQIGANLNAINFGELSEGRDRDYILNRSNGQIELIEPLVANQSLTAGSISTRAFSDGVSETYDFDSIGASSNLIVCIDGGFRGQVTTGDAAAPYNDFVATGLQNYSTNLFTGFYIEWISGNNLGETSYVNTYDSSTGQITTVTDFTNPIVPTDQFILCQVIDFTHATDFGDPENVTVDEVVSVINSQLLGGRAEALVDDSLRIRTSNFDLDGSLEIKGGSANTVLGLSTDPAENQRTNLAYVKSRNTDRAGWPTHLGYTLGSNQNLIMILDEDPANKTFSVNMYIAGAADSVGGANTFIDSNVGATYTTDDYFNDFFIFWTSGSNEGNVQMVTSYDGTTGTFNTEDVFPTPNVAPAPGDTFRIVPRTAENVVKMLNDLNLTTFSIQGTAEVTGISGDDIQLSTKTPGSNGKIFVTGGTANRIGIAIQAIPAGSPVNDVSVNSISGLSKGMLTSLTVDGEVTTGDSTVPYDTFIDTSMITSFANYFTGMEIEFLSGDNVGHSTTIASYDNTTGEIQLTDAGLNAIAIGDTFRIFTPAVITDIQGSAAPYIVELSDLTNTAIDVSAFTAERSAAIRDRNGLDFENIQIEGVDGYKYFTGLIQKVQWTIDGLDRDPQNFPGVGAAGTQFEVLPPVLVKLKLIVNATPQEGVSLSSISGQISNSITEYINSLGVGEDVILSEIICAALEVNGVADVEVVNFEENIVIADGELARIDSQDLTVG